MHLRRRRRRARRENILGTTAKTKSDEFTIQLGEFETEIEAALAYDRAAVLLYGENAITNFPPEDSAHVVFPPEIMRMINAARAGRSKPN